MIDVWNELEKLLYLLSRPWADKANTAGSRIGMKEAKLEPVDLEFRQGYWLAIIDRITGLELVVVFGN